MRLSAFFFRTLVLFILSAACGYSPAALGETLAVDGQAKLAPAMEFALVRGSDPACEPECPEWIWADGQIKADTPKRFRAFLKSIGNRQIPVIIQSPGGDMNAAFALGKLIRAKKLDVAVGTTRFTSCSPRDKVCKPDKKKMYVGVAATAFTYCYSACPMILAGGSRRLVGPWARVGVHQVTTVMHRDKILYRDTTRIVKGKKVVKRQIIKRTKGKTITTTTMSRGYQKKIESYLTEMGVGKGLLDPIKKTAASDILVLANYEMLALNLITGLDQADALTGPTICKITPKPTNCRVANADQMMPLVVQVPKIQAASLASKQVEQTKENSDLVGDMQFFVARNGGFSCVPVCAEWIAAEGTITPATPAMLEKILDRLGGRKLPLVLNSPGGDVSASIAMGRLIRARQLDVAVAETRYQKCDPADAGCKPVDGVYRAIPSDYRGRCDFACSLVLAGGVRRLVGPNVSMTLKSLGDLANVSGYLSAMGLGPDLITHMSVNKYGNNFMPVLRDLVKTGLVTTSASAEAIVGFQACKTVPLPDHCRPLTTSK